MPPAHWVPSCSDTVVRTPALLGSINHSRAPSWYLFFKYSLFFCNTRMHVSALPEEARLIGSTGAGINDAYLQCRCWDPNLGPLQMQFLLLTLPAAAVYNTLLFGPCSEARRVYNQERSPKWPLQFTWHPSCHYRNGDQWIWRLSLKEAKRNEWLCSLEKRHTQLRVSTGGGVCWLVLCQS